MRSLGIAFFALALVSAAPPEKPAAPAAAATATATAADAADEAARAAEAKRLEALEREYERIEGSSDSKHETQPPPGVQVNSSSERSFAYAFVQMVLVLGAVCLLAYLVLGKLLPRMMRIEAPVAQRRIMQVIDRMPLDQRRAILVLRIGDSYYLVGASEQGIALLSRLDSDDITRALAAAETNRPQLGKLAGTLLRRTEKG